MCEKKTRYGAALLDLVIVGGGPAGLATAIFAARSGLSSLVIERRSLPLDKPCGEGLMPPAVALLQEMGVTVPHTELVGIRYRDGARVAEARFEGRVGWGLRRTTLMQGLVHRAEELGVELWFGARGTTWSVGHDRVRVGCERGAVEGKYLVAADGLHSRIRKEAGLERRSRGAKRFGIRRHYRVSSPSPWVEVHWADGGEAYVTPIAASELGVALLSVGEPVGFEATLDRFPELRKRLGGAPATTEIRGAGPFRQRVRQRGWGRLALVGDAAGYLDPISGEGLSLAFQAAQALVETILGSGGLAGYDAAYRRLSRPYYRMTKVLLSVSRRPRLRRRVMASLAEQPEIFSRLVAISTGERSFRSLGVRGTTGLLGGILGRPGSVPS